MYKIAWLICKSFYIWMPKTFGIFSCRLYLSLYFAYKSEKLDFYFYLYIEKKPNYFRRSLQRLEDRTKKGKMMQDEHLGGPARRNVFSQAIGRISQLYQRYLDLWTPHVVSRWTFAFFLIFVFILRICLSQGWYIVTYALGIYYLNLFIAFLTPKIDPAMEFDDGEGPELPTRSNEEFRPFIRRLPEFKFWYSVMKSTVVAMICTMFDCFNIPVFWPILVMYFITLFCITMKRQIKHMIKYRYLPITYGKPKYQNYEDTSRLIPSK